MKDDAGNLLFSHNGKDYRIYNFNWRLQREFCNQLIPLQEKGGTRIIGNDSSHVQDHIFSRTQVKQGGAWEFIEQPVADKLFKNVSDAYDLFIKIIEVSEGFLSQGGESSHPTQASDEKGQGTIKKPSPTS